jgi:PEP-CTERM/exosortase A-associated glycosyltransferase
MRRVVGPPLAAWGERMIRRRPEHVFAAQIAFIGLVATGDLDEAAAWAGSRGTARESAPRARRQLAQLAMACGMPEAARAIVKTHPEDRHRTVLAVRARLALEDGQYREARELGSQAAAAGDVGSRAFVERVDGRLRVLDPAWTPDLGRSGRPSGSGRARAVPGRILHLLSNSLPYRQAGYTLRAQAIGQAQVAAGLDPHFATRAGFPRSEGVHDAPREDWVDDIPYYRLAPDFSDLGRHDLLVTETARALLPLVDRLRPAVLHPTSNHLQAQAALAVAERRSIPVVYEVRGFLEETWASKPGLPDEAILTGDRYRLNREAETRAMRASQAVVTLSETMREDIVARGCAPEDVVVIPNAVDIERFGPIPRDDALASSLGIEPGDTVVGYISSFSPYEGIEYLLEAAAVLRGDGRRLKVLLVGDGESTPSLVATSRRLGLDDGTTIMTGRVPHDRILRYHSIIDVFVVPRSNDRVSRLVTPLKPYEAMAMERALVVSDVPALREIVRPGETGLVFRAEDANDLAAVLDGLIDDPDQRAALGREARAWVSEHRTWAQNGRRYRDLYERLGVV